MMSLPLITVRCDASVGNDRCASAEVFNLPAHGLSEIEVARLFRAENPGWALTVLHGVTRCPRCVLVMIQARG